MAVTVISYPNNQINESFTTNSTINSNEVIKNLWVDVSAAFSDTYIEVTYNGETITYNIVDEYKYSPVDVFFVNKEGQQQTMTFFKKREDSLSLDSKEYLSDNGRANLGNHQYQKFNIQGRETFKINSGFIEEENNETVKQLLISERVWIYENSEFRPVNIKNSKLEIKNRVNNRLINYEIEFEDAFDLINSQ